MPSRSKLKYLPLPIFAMFAVAPILLAMAAGLIGEFMGYEMHEGGPPPQSDLHATLLRIGVAGWYFLVTVPAAVALSLLWLVVLAVMERRARAKAP
jgi:hypothetical protein